MNKWIGTGRLTRDIELKTSAGGTKFINNGLAVDRRDKEKGTDFFNITAFGKTAEFINNYMHKGSKIAVVGRLQSETYTDRNGNKVNSTSIIIDEVEFGESKGATPANDSDFLNVAATIEEELPF